MLEKKRKKGQVSIFIIIGVILIIVAAFLFFSGRVPFLISESDRTTGQISDLINNCVLEAASSGAFLLSVQGGFIDVPPQFANNPFRQIDLGGFIIPNWDANTGDIPTITSMEFQLNNFIEQEASECVRLGLQESFESFFNLQYSMQNFQVISTINPQNIIVETFLPIQFNLQNDDRIFQVSDYRVVLEDLNLGDMYALAVSIFNEQARSSFIEELVLDQIFSASDYSSNRFSMPSEGMIFSCSPQIWTIFQLQENLANLNNNNFRYLQFMGTFDRTPLIESMLNEELETSDLAQYFLRNYRIPLQNTRPSFINYDVNVVMPTGQIRAGDGFFNRFPFREFLVSPSTSSGLVKPINLRLSDLKLPVPCVQIYHHTYTLDYDLLVQINDLSSESGRFFQFPLRVQIFDNTPRQRGFTPVIDQPIVGFDSEFYCAEEQAIFPADIYALNVQTNDFIPDVNVSFSCVGVTCNVGSTSRPRFEGFDMVGLSLLETNLPFCFGGRIRGEKEGYFMLGTSPAEIEATSINNGVLTIDIDMVPTRKFSVTSQTFFAIDRDTCQTRLVERVGDGLFMAIFDNTEYDFQSVAMWPNDPSVGMFTEIELLDYDVNYNVTIIYLGPNDNLRGFLTLENWNPYPLNGNSIEITIPSVDQGLEGEDFLEYMEYVENILIGQNCQGTPIPYGIFLR